MINVATRKLWDHENREVYESSHSVVLALLAAHAQRVGDGSGIVPTTDMDSVNSKGKENGQATATARPPAERIVPFYTNCLLEVQFFVSCCVSGLMYICHFPCVIFCSTVEFRRKSADQRSTADRLCGTCSECGIQQHCGGRYLGLVLYSISPRCPLGSLTPQDLRLQFYYARRC